MTNHPNRKAAAEERNHAKENAKAWMESIGQMVAALDVDYDRLRELREFKESEGLMNTDALDELRELTESATIDGDLMESAEAARQRIEESPLSVQVRSGWRNPGDDHGDPEEFEILLSTGGPALRIRGELGEHCEPSRAWLEYQDWGTGWTQYFDADSAALLTYCGVFYFGE